MHGSVAAWRCTCELDPTSPPGSAHRAPRRVAPLRVTRSPAPARPDRVSWAVAAQSPRKQGLRTSPTQPPAPGHRGAAVAPHGYHHPHRGRIEYSHRPQSDQPLSPIQAPARSQSEGSVSPVAARVGRAAPGGRAHAAQIASFLGFKDTDQAGLRLGSKLGLKKAWSTPRLSPATLPASFPARFA